MIISPVFVGGAEASQKGFGELIAPAKLRTRISGMSSNLRSLQDGESRAFATGHRIHHLTSAVDAITAGKVTRVGRLSGCRLNDDARWWMRWPVANARLSPSKAAE